MSRKVFFFIALIIPQLINGQNSKVIDSLSIKSSVLKMDKSYAIYLPKDYNSTTHYYPVLYLLHGFNGNQSDWSKHGDVQQIADSMIDIGAVKPMIIVMPDAGSSYYMNSSNGVYQYEDYFIKELLPFIENNYRCEQGKGHRAIAGLSMGGFGSLLYSLHHPQLFVSCAALSAAIRTDEQVNELSYKAYMRRYKSAMGDIKEGDDRITDFWNENSILYLIENMPKDQRKSLRFYIDIGDDDFLYKGNSLLHIYMTEQEVPHEYRVNNGSHKWEYWRNGLPSVLKFVSEGF